MNPAAAGACSGGFWGQLVGMIFFNRLLGRPVGAGAGAVSGKLSDIGINDQMMKATAASFAPGSSALFVLVRKATPDKVLEGLRAFAGKGKALRASLKKDGEESLRNALEQA